MKRFLLFLFISISASVVMAQQSVGIGTATPNSSAVLDLTSTSKGLLIPRMTGAQRTAIASPATGLLVFQSNTVAFPPSSPGFYMYDGTAWKLIAKDEDIVPPGSSNSWTLSGNNQYSTPSGNVGVGVTSPGDKLHVLGNVRIANGNSTPILKLYGGSSPFFFSQIDFDDNTGTNMHRIFSSSGLMGFSSVGHSDHLTLTDDGSIMGGTGIIMRLNGNGNTTSTLTLEDEIPKVLFTQSSDSKAQVGVSAGGTMFVGTSIDNTGNGIWFQAVGATRMALTSGGNLGIGTLSPTNRLHVVGSSLTEGDATLRDDNVTLSLQNAAAVDKGFVQLSGDNLRIGCYSSNTNGNLIFRMGGGDRMQFDNNGNIMIGTSSPVAPFTVVGQTAMNNGTSDVLSLVGKLVVNKGGEAIHIGGVDAAINFFNGAQQRGYLWNTGIDMQLGASQGGKLYMNGSQILMGTTISVPSDYKLGVGGKIICEELKVKLQSSGWPDYVFHKDYKLPSLREVEKYIDANKHLPNIPSAAEVEKNGIEVGDMQKRLMEKVEELTLYIIELKKQVDELKAAQKN